MKAIHNKVSVFITSLVDVVTMSKIGKMKAIHNKHGHSVIFESEEHKQTGQRFTEGLWDGLRFEVAGAETATDNNILRAIEHCADKRSTEIAVIVFPRGGFSEAKIRKALGRYRGLKKLNDGEYIDFKRIICIQNEDIVYDKPF